MDAGADISARDNDGQTALHVNCYGSDLIIYKLERHYQSWVRYDVLCRRQNRGPASEILGYESYDIIDLPDNHASLRSILKRAKFSLLKDSILSKKRHGIIREIVDTHAVRKQALQYAHVGAGHRGVEGTLNILASCFWFPLMEKFGC